MEMLFIHTCALCWVGGDRRVLKQAGSRVLARDSWERGEMGGSTTHCSLQSDMRTRADLK